MSLIPQLTDGGRGILIAALSGSPLNFTKLKIGNGAAPEEPESGDYWYDTANRLLFRYSKRWDKSSRHITVGATAPETPADEDLWYDTENAVLNYYGDGWIVSQTTITCSSTTPSDPEAGDYWYDTANEILYTYGNKWNAETDSTISTAAEPPESPQDGYYWYDQANTQLKVYAPLWGKKKGVTLTCADKESASQNDGDYWYDTENAVLKVYSSAKSAWAVSQQAFAYGTAAPEKPSLGAWWYDTNKSTLMEYTLGWTNDTAHTFNYGKTPPATPAIGDWWYDTSLHVYGIGWVADTQKNFTYGSGSSNNPHKGYWWFDSANSSLYEYDALFQRDTGDTFTYSATEPSRAYDDDLWYDTTAGELKVYVTGWQQDAERNYSYSQSPPVSPTAGDWWYDTEQQQLFEYNGAQWTVSTTTITCSTSPPATQDTLTDLVNPLITIEINEITKGTNYVSLTGVFDNSGVTASFNWAETGVFAEDIDGNEVLYAYCHTGEQYETVPANNTGKTVRTTLTVLVIVGDAEDVSASIGEGAIYATKEQLESHKRDFSNPHGVNAEQIGLGNVENVSPSEMTIEYKIAAKLEEPESGDKMWVVLSKVKKAINNLILHLKARNPHGITAAKINAASATHKHATTDITSGILPATRGGTGVASINELASLLGANFKVPVFGSYTGDGSTKRTISLEFTPSAVLVVDSRGRMTVDNVVYGGLCVGTKGVRTPSSTAVSHDTTWSNSHTALMIGTNCFYANEYNTYCKTNTLNENYYYIAFR